jgi:hypothetical protein
MSVRLLGDQEGDPQFPIETNETKREIQAKSNKDTLFISGEHTGLLPTEFKHRFRKIILRSRDPRLSISQIRVKFSELFDGGSPAAIPQYTAPLHQ